MQSRPVVDDGTVGLGGGTGPYVPMDIGIFVESLKNGFKWNSGIEIAVWN